jgi:hypothetical protein
VGVQLGRVGVAVYEDLVVVRWIVPLDELQRGQVMRLAQA